MNEEQKRLRRNENKRKLRAKIATETPPILIKPDLVVNTETTPLKYKPKKAKNIVLKEIIKSKILYKVKHFYIETSVNNIKKIKYYLKDYKLLSINPIISSNSVKEFCDLEFVKKNP